MRDLIERLRKWNIHDDGTLDGGRVMRDMRKAADDIERLSAELFAAELRAKTYEEGYDESQDAVRYFQARVEALEADIVLLVNDRSNLPLAATEPCDYCEGEALICPVCGDHTATEQEGEI